MIELEDPIALFEQAAVQEKNAAKREARFKRLTRQVFTTEAGRDWLRIALSRSNFMGSVFSAEDTMNVAAAAYRDGIRSVFSDILNSAAGAIHRNPTTTEDHE